MKEGALSPEAIPANFIDGLLGPFSLSEALAVAAERDGVRMAISSPEGTFVAVQIGEKVVVRRVCRLSGRAGSQMDTGEWLEPKAADAYSWRPA